MKKYVKVPLVSCGLAVVLLFATFSVSGTSTVRWNGQPCAVGTEYGFPMPFLYSMNRESLTPPQTHSTLVCPSSADVNPIGTNVSSLIIDYLCWFAISLAIVYGLSVLLSKKERVNLPEKEEATHATGFESPLAN